MTAIEHRQWQQIYEPQIDGDEGREVDELLETDRRRLARSLGDADGAAHVLDRPRAAEELPQHRARHPHEARRLLGAVAQRRDRPPTGIDGRPPAHADDRDLRLRSEEHTSELQSIMRPLY